MEMRRRTVPYPNLVVGLVAVALVVAACSPSNPEPSASTAGVSAAPSNSAAPAPTTAPSPKPSPVATPTPPPLDRPLAGSGSIAIRRADGSMWLTGTDGRSTLLADSTKGAFGFPTWSPDGTRIAAIRTLENVTAIVIFRPDAPETAPLTIFESATIAPFYLSWTPDGQDVSFLASDPDTLTLRIAPADGSAPVDGSGAGSIIHSGGPFYYDWIDSDHFVAHAGVGVEAFLGELGRDGLPVGPAIADPGTFRSVVVSPDKTFLGYVHAGPEGKDEIVVAARDGSSDHVMPVFGFAAVDFSPTDDTLASIGSIEPLREQFAVPVGPLRVMDAQTGKVRTLLDGDVVSFAWSPDGKTIAAIRVVEVPARSAAASAGPSTAPAASAGPSTSRAPSQQREVRMTFVDVASGKVRSDPVIAPGAMYVSMLMTYFDQYALSHELWAPDSSSLIVPQSHSDGLTHVDVLFPDGEPSVSLDGDIGFWSPKAP
jgi:TolB protein